MKSKLRIINVFISYLSVIAVIAILTMPMFGGRLSIREESCCARHPIEGCINYCCSSSELCGVHPITGLCTCMPLP